MSLYHNRLLRSKFDVLHLNIDGSPCNRSFSYLAVRLIRLIARQLGCTFITCKVVTNLIVHGHYCIRTVKEITIDMSHCISLISLIAEYENLHCRSKCKHPSNYGSGNQLLGIQISITHAKFGKNFNRNYGLGFDVN